MSDTIKKIILICNEMYTHDKTEQETIDRIEIEITKMIKDIGDELYNKYMNKADLYVIKAQNEADRNNAIVNATISIAYSNLAREIRESEK